MAAWNVSTPFSFHNLPHFSCVLTWLRVNDCVLRVALCSDHAGIATQMLVERQLSSEGLSRKAMGREAFLERVWQWKNEKSGSIQRQMRRLGASADWSREKFTLDSDMNLAVTEAFVRLHEKGLIYRGQFLVNWSPALQTAVSDLEVEHREEQGKLYYFKYWLDDGSDFLPVSTTRPETILGDSAVCVHPQDSRYSKWVGRKVRVPMTSRTIPGKWALCKHSPILLSQRACRAAQQHWKSLFSHLCMR